MPGATSGRATKAVACSSSPMRFRSLSSAFQRRGRLGGGGDAVGVTPDGGMGTSAWADAATVTRGLPATGEGAGVGVAGAVPALPPAVAGGEETPPVDAGPLEGPWAVGSLDEDMQEGSRCDLYNYRTTGERRGAMGHFLDRPGQVGAVAGLARPGFCLNSATLGAGWCGRTQNDCARASEGATFRGSAVSAIGRPVVQPVRQGAGACSSMSGPFPIPPERHSCAGSGSPPAG